MHVSPFLFASFVIALPLTLLVLVAVMRLHHWRTYRVSIDVGRSGEERTRAVAADVDDVTEDEPSETVVRGPGGVRGWLLRNLYTYYRRR